MPISRASAAGSRLSAPARITCTIAGRVHDADEIQRWSTPSLDFWLTAGRYTEEFESGLAEFLGAETVLTVNSGSSANLVAFSTLTRPKLKDRRVKPGDEVITVAAGFPTTVNPIIQNRAVPVFVDVELGTYVPTLAAIEAAISPRTKAVMMAHTMGVPFELRECASSATPRPVAGRGQLRRARQRYDGRLTGTFGDLATFSFYPAHHITMGEGGAVVDQRRRPGPHRPQLPRLGPRLLLRRRREQHLRQALHASSSARCPSATTTSTSTPTSATTSR